MEKLKPFVPLFTATIAFCGFFAVLGTTISLFLKPISTEISGIKTEIISMKTEIKGIKTEISSMKTEINILKIGQEDINKRLDRIEKIILTTNK